MEEEINSSRETKQSLVKVCMRSAKVFLTDEIEPCDEGREACLKRLHQRKVPVEGAVVAELQRCVDELNACKLGIGAQELFRLIDIHLDDLLRSVLTIV